MYMYVRDIVTTCTCSLLSYCRHLLTFTDLLDSSTEYLYAVLFCLLLVGLVTDANLRLVCGQCCDVVLWSHTDSPVSRSFLFMNT